MKLKKCLKCHKLIRSRATMIVAMKKTLMGNAIRKQYFMREMFKVFYHSSCYPKAR